MHALLEIHLPHGVAGLFNAHVRAHAGIDQRQLDIVQRGGAWKQVEGLKNEPDFLVPDARQIVVDHIADEVSVDVIQALGRRIQTADQVHEGGFSGARRTHDGDTRRA